jgi:hypothetical protein
MHHNHKTEHAGDPALTDIGRRFLQQAAEIFLPLLVIRRARGKIFHGDERGCGHNTTHRRGESGRGSSRLRASSYDSY